MFIIEDKFHAEQSGNEHSTFEQVVLELRRLAAVPWNEPPNRAPCIGWETCGREYVIIE